MTVNKALLSAAALALGTVCSAGLASAATILVNPADAQVRDTGVIAQDTNWVIRVGEQNAPGAAVAVLPFQLPVLGANERFSEATLRIQLESFAAGVAPTFNVDLYALARIADDPTPLASDFFAGPLDTDATLLQDDLLTALTPLRTATGTPTEFVFTSDDANARLRDFLNEAYADGANAGRYVFLRLSPDVFPMPSGNRAYNVLAGNSGSNREWPQIIYSTEIVPEPGTASLALVSGGMVLMARRRR